MGNVTAMTQAPVCAIPGNSKENTNLNKRKTHEIKNETLIHFQYEIVANSKQGLPSALDTPSLPLAVVIAGHGFNNCRNRRRLRAGSGHKRVHERSRLQPGQPHAHWCGAECDEGIFAGAPTIVADLLHRFQ
jgi:hypothetical protein